MCNGIAIIALKKGDEIEVFCDPQNGSHDKLASKTIPVELQNNYIKLEYIFPGEIRLDCPDKECRRRALELGMAEKTGIGNVVRLRNDVLKTIVVKLQSINFSGWKKELMQHANLPDADLSGASLCDADLNSANLRYANLCYATLNSAVLRDACLCHADLRHVHLSGADLSGAYLDNASLSSADLSYAGLWDARLCHADLHGADLRYANLYYADLCGADLRNANLRDADLRQANLHYADLRGADLHGASLWDANLDGAKGEQEEIENEKRRQKEAAD